jgi:hypothetical protein
MVHRTGQPQSVIRRMWRSEKPINAASGVLARRSRATPSIAQANATRALWRIAWVVFPPHAAPEFPPSTH